MMLSPLIFRGLAALLLPLLFTQSAGLPGGLAHVLHAGRWQQRLLLIGAPTAGDAVLQSQKRLLLAAPTGLAARDLQVIILPYDQFSAADRRCWTRQLGQSLSGFRVVLIGKDGGVKRSSARPLAPADLFATIDQMPMRRQEMRR